jgi:hypothetical protein
LFLSLVTKKGIATYLKNNCSSFFPRKKESKKSFAKFNARDESRSLMLVVARSAPQKSLHSSLSRFAQSSEISHQPTKLNGMYIVLLKALDNFGGVIKGDERYCGGGEEIVKERN